MSELEHELRAVELEFPATPDLAARVRRDLPDRPRPVWPLRLTLGVAVLALAVATGLAVSPARSAIFRFFGIGAVDIEFVDQLPDVRPPTSLDLGTEIDAEDAPFRLRRSRLLGAPDAVYLQDGVVTLLYGTPERIHLLVTELVDSGFTPSIGKKLRATGTRVEFVSLRRSTWPGLWIEGAPHVVRLPGGSPRLARNTLIWTDGQITLRLEGAESYDQALAVADSFG